MFICQVITGFQKCGKFKFKMKEILKKLYFALRNLIKSVISFISVLLFSSISSNKKIKNCINKNHKHNECVVMGNGPSLKFLFEDDFVATRNKDIFAVNFFCLNKYFIQAKPSFYVLLDPKIFRESDLTSKVDELVSILNEISWKMILFVPTGSNNSDAINSICNSKISIVPFNYTPVEGLESLENYFFKRNLGMPMPQTVINATIFLAINLNYDKIHLYGVEQSWLKHLAVDNNNRVSVDLHHFYKGSDMTGENRTLSEFLLSQVAVFKSHMRLQKYAVFKGVKILNHTPGTYIDAYERALIKK